MRTSGVRQARRNVVIRPFGFDWHVEHCCCGCCNGIGKAYAAAAFDAAEVKAHDGAHELCEAIFAVYAPTYGAASHNALLESEKNGLRVLNDDEFEHFRCSNLE